MNYKMPNPVFVILAASLGALAFAFAMQFGFGVDPCELCLWQRTPYAVTALVVIMMLIMKPGRKVAAWSLGLCAALFFGDAALALFHSGVERHWWEFHSACTGSAIGGSIEEMRKALLEKPVTRCDQISWSIFGLSMANLNVVYATVLGIFSLASFRKILSSAA